MSRVLAGAMRGSARRPCHFNAIMPAMKRETKISRAPQPIRRGARVAAFALFAALSGAQLAHAASFRCPHNASASERIVCNDPALSALDDQLAALYRSAVDATPDATALEADRISQWQWRQHNCKDKPCVADWYHRRIAELEGDLSHGKQATAQRVKDGVVEQQLTPAAQNAVLDMKGIPAAPEGQKAAPPSSVDAGKAVANADGTPLHLRKMPSGVAADARQQHLAASHAAHDAATTAASAPKPTEIGSDTQSTGKPEQTHAAQASAQHGACAAVATTEPAHTAEAQVQDSAVTVK